MKPKMNCANCGKPITDDSISEDSYLFCNTLCRYDWRRKGKPNPFASMKKGEGIQSVSEIDLDFPIEPIGFEKRNLMIRPSYWVAPKLFLDGKQLIPVKKKIFSRSRDYAAVSNFGKNVAIRVKRRPFDSVPILYIDGQEIQIARLLTKWEYFWICIPLLLVFGGAIGGLVGGAAAFSNAILIRKMKQTFLRYLFTGATSAMAVMIYIRIVGFANPYLINFNGQPTIDKQLKEGAIELNRICPKMIDKETRLDSANSLQEKTFTYYYTLINRTQKELDTGALRRSMTPQLIQNIRTNELMQWMRENLVAMVYCYSDKNGVKLLDIHVTPNDYK